MNQYIDYQTWSCYEKKMSAIGLLFINFLYSLYLINALRNFKDETLFIVIISLLETSNYKTLNRCKKLCNKSIVFATTSYLLEFLF